MRLPFSCTNYLVRQFYNCLKSKEFKLAVIDKSRTIIYVDDDEDDRDIFREVMRDVDPHLDLVLAKDGHDALAKLQEMNPICLFIDMNMPKMNGLQLLAILKGDPVMAQIPAFILTTALTPNQTHELKSLGAQDYLIKPSNFEDFKNLLRGSLRKHFGLLI
jgi:CheY-like chemotaxis protein